MLKSEGAFLDGSKIDRQKEASNGLKLLRAVERRLEMFGIGY